MLNNFFEGQDHCQNAIAHVDFQIASHRIDHKIPCFLSDSGLKHQLLYGVHKDDFYTRNDINLDYILKACKANNIVPLINNNAPYLDRNIPIIEYVRRCKLIDLILYEYGFKKAYVSIMNEPGKFYHNSTSQYCQFVNASNDVVKYFPIVAGNDEWNMLDWDFLLDHAKFNYLGVHPLSSLGYPANWNILSSWASKAAAKGKRCIATEAGSWFKSYSSSEGWAVIKNLTLKCKYLNYEAVCIVCVDINEDHPILGFRRFDKNYNRLEHTSHYWDEFIKLVNREGKKYKEEEEDMKLEEYYYQGKVKFPNDPDKNGVKFLQMCFGIKVDGDMGNQFDGAVKAYQTEQGIDIDGIVGPQTFNEIFKSGDNNRFYGLVHSYWARGITKFYEEE